MTYRILTYLRCSIDLQAGARSLADEFRLSIGEHDEEDYEIKQRFGQFGGKAERLWACGYE